MARASLFSKWHRGKVLTTLLCPTKTSQEGRSLGPAVISLLLAPPVNDVKRNPTRFVRNIIRCLKMDATDSFVRPTLARFDISTRFGG